MAALDAGESLPADLRESIAALRVALATAAEGGVAGAEQPLPASISNAAVIASLAARCAALARRAADPGAGDGQT